MLHARGGPSRRDCRDKNWDIVEPSIKYYWLIFCFSFLGWMLRVSLGLDFLYWKLSGYVKRPIRIPRRQETEFGMYIPSCILHVNMVDTLYFQYNWIKLFLLYFPFTLITISISLKYTCLMLCNTQTIIIRLRRVWWNIILLALFVHNHFNWVSINWWMYFIIGVTLWKTL